VAHAHCAHDAATAAVFPVDRDVHMPQCPIPNRHR